MNTLETIEKNKDLKTFGPVRRNGKTKWRNYKRELKTSDAISLRQYVEDVLKQSWVSYLTDINLMIFYDNMLIKTIDEGSLFFKFTSRPHDKKELKFRRYESLKETGHCS